jgi:hypothetical protein
VQKNLGRREDTRRNMIGRGVWMDLNHELKKDLEKKDWGRRM